MSALDSLVSQIVIDSEYGPQIVIDRPFAADATTSGGSVVMGILKPRISFVNSLGAPVSTAPWGSPGPTKWEYVQAGLMVLTAFIFVIIAKRKG